MKKDNFNNQSINIDFQVTELETNELETLNGGGVMWWLLGYAAGTVNTVGNETGTQLMMFG